MFETVTILLVAASIFGYFNYRIFKLPFAVAMLIAGLMASLVVLGIDQYRPDLHLGAGLRDFALNDVDFSNALMRGMLSFLLFAGALHTDMNKLRTWSKPILSLATVGVGLSTILIGGGSYYVFQFVGTDIPFIWCLVFGSLISPTDPVAVLGIMKAAGAPKAVESKVVGESLFNDGVGVVLFTVLVSVAVGGDQELSVGSVASLIGIEVIGGLALGLAAGWITYLALKDLEEPNLETLITVAVVMGVSLLAFRLHTSAPLACVVAGLFVGNKGRAESMSKETERSLDTIWSFIDESLNAALFLLIGLEVVAFNFSGSFLLASIILVFLGLAARTVSVVVPLTFLQRSMKFQKGTKRILVWGGIKGGISVALALSLPRFDGRDLILSATYVIVVVSILSQGLTVGKLIKLIFENQTSEPDQAAVDA